MNFTEIVHKSRNSAKNVAKRSENRILLRLNLCKSVFFLFRSPSGAKSFQSLSIFLKIKILLQQHNVLLAKFGFDAAENESAKNCKHWQTISVLRHFEKMPDNPETSRGHTFFNLAITNIEEVQLHNSCPFTKWLGNFERRVLGQEIISSDGLRCAQLDYVCFFVHIVRIYLGLHVFYYFFHIRPFFSS